MLFRRLAATVLMAGIMLSPSLARAVPTPAPNSYGEGLQISPAVKELQAYPGQMATMIISLKNVASQDLIARPEVDDFGASGETGQPKIYPANEDNGRFSLKSWVQPLGDIRIGANQVKDITVTIRVPANAEPGGHYGVVRFTALPPNLQGTGVALSASIGTLVLMKVPGNVTESLKYDDFFTANSKGSKSSFFEKAPVTFIQRIQNTGTVHERPKGHLLIKNMFGKQIADIAVNSANGAVLPDSVRRYDETLNQKGLLGHYTATANLVYSSGKVLESNTIGFWVVPVIPALIILLILIALFFGLRIGVRRYNAHILAQARRR